MGHNPVYGHSMSGLQTQPWNFPFHVNQQLPGGENTQKNYFVPSYPRKPFPGNVNPTWGQAFQSNSPFQGGMANQQANVGYLAQNPPQPNLTRPSNYFQMAYGPTGMPTILPPQIYQFPQVNRQFPFLSTLDLPDLSQILNDPILHSPFWLIIPAKLLLDIPNFEGQSQEYPNNHVMTFHLWCSSNSLMDDSIQLCIFQCTLTGSATKWYIELLRGFFNDFNTLAMDFLTIYELSIQFETGMEILSSFKQSSYAHISYHIHEWRRR
jgi:hypothetical protein